MSVLDDNTFVAATDRTALQVIGGGVKSCLHTKVVLNSGAKLQQKPQTAVTLFAAKVAPFQENGDLPLSAPYLRGGNAEVLADVAAQISHRRKLKPAYQG